MKAPCYASNEPAGRNDDRGPKQERLETSIDLPNGVPSHDTFGRVFAALTLRITEVAADRTRIALRAVAAAEAALNRGRLGAADVMEREADLAMARAAELAVGLEILVERETAHALSGDVGR